MLLFFVFAKHQLSLGQLVTSAMTNFTRAKLTLHEHSKQNAHLMASMDVVKIVWKEVVFLFSSF